MEALEKNAFSQTAYSVQIIKTPEDIVTWKRSTEIHVLTLNKVNQVSGME